MRLALSCLGAMLPVFFASAQPASNCPAPSLSISHSSADSYCEFCGDGQVQLTITNATPNGPGNNASQAISNITLREDLGRIAEIYEYQNNSAQVSGLGRVNPAISGGGDILTWNLGNGVTLEPSESVTVSFRLDGLADEQEELLSLANRILTASASYDYQNCNNGVVRENTPDATFELPLLEPTPSLQIRGWNRDANQGRWTQTIYGNVNDDVVWRVRVRNTGRAALQDVRFDQMVADPNVTISHACAFQGRAFRVADNDGVDLNNECVSASNTMNDWEMTSPFSNGRTDSNGAEIDVAGGPSNEYIFLVGKVNSSCDNGGITTDDFQWGCEVDRDTGVGGVTATSAGASPGAANATMSTVATGDLDIVREITGINIAQPLGARGYVTVTITNLTGGSVKDISFVNDLPPQYVVDTTYTPEILETTRGNGHNANYAASFDGMVDTLQWRIGGVWNQWHPDPLQNNAPEFRLISSAPHPDYADQENMLRHGDRVRIRFRIVTVEPAFFDTAADLDVEVENPADGTDPASNSRLAEDNRLTLESSDFCAGARATQVETDAVTPHPEDLDLTTVYPLYIIRDDGESPLTIDVTNNGGHDASDYTVYATFGEGMQVVSNNRGCSLVADRADLHPLWNDPAYLPATASVYRCTPAELGTTAQLGTIAPGATERVVFQVRKNHTAANDDLTFRADVVGEITLRDGSPLTFPTPALLDDPAGGTTPSQQRANNYTLDAFRAKALGFNLKKKLRGQCSELNEAGFANTDVLIGEECTVEIQAGGWFGFQTPGYTLIQVENISFRDELPDGQGYLADRALGCTDVTLPDASSRCTAITGVTRGGGIGTALSETDPEWTVNDPINVRDNWFLTDLSTRILNDSEDVVAGPNRHGQISTDFGRTFFTAIFQLEDGSRVPIDVDNSGGVPANIPGFPPVADWQVDLRITEPKLEIVKEVCNENLYGCALSAAEGTDGWSALSDEGHRDQTYLFRLIVSNRAADSGVTRAPAYDVVVTDTLDASGQMCVRPLDADGLDNDADGALDESAASLAGLEGLVGTAAGLNNYAAAVHCREGGVPAVITLSYEHSDALKRLDPGQSVTAVYRVQPHESVAPLQRFTNRVEVTAYDSLPGVSGSQTTPIVGNALSHDPQSGSPRSDSRDTPRLGGARIHEEKPSDSAQMRIIDVETLPKQALALSNGAVQSDPLNGANRDQMVIGEEIRYQLVARIPAAKLRDFVIRDELPAGMRCIEAPVVDLNAAPYAQAGIIPAGTVTPTCTSSGSGDYVEWDFGDREVTTVTGSLFDFPLEFIARVDNSPQTNNGDVLVNGGSGSLAQLRYVDEAGNTVVKDFGAHEVEILEPDVQLSLTLSEPQVDGDDVLTVNVTASNTGTATAYDLRVLDDLRGTKFRYVAGSAGGNDGPDVVEFLDGDANAPIFRWNRVDPVNDAPPYAIAAGGSIDFSFQVRVVGAGDAQSVEPLEVLQNTLQARWQSLPGEDIHLSAGLGRPGAADGMRIGILPNSSPADPVNDYETRAVATTQVAPVAFAKQESAASQAVVSTIGAHKTFTLTVDLPEGLTRDLSIADNLAAGGTSFVVSRDSNYAFTCTSSDPSLRVNGAALAADCSNFIALPQDGDANVATWNIGTVETGSEDDFSADTFEPQLLITYFARVDNAITGTAAGDRLRNSADLSYTSGADLNGNTSTPVLTDNTATTTAVEPQLTISKAVTDASGNPVTSAQGGDKLRYTLTITHSGASSADAFDLNIVDTLPPELRLDSGFTPTASIDGVPVSGFTAAPAGAPSGPLVWGRGNLGDNSLDLPLSSTLEITYQADLLSVFGGDVTNSARVDWTSLDDTELDDTRYERHGQGCPSVTQPNDYCSAPVTLSLSTVDTSALVKTIVEDSYLPADDATLRIGDTVTFALALELQPGTTRAVTVTDVLPTGFTLQSFTVDGGAGDYAFSALSEPAAGDSGTLVWDFGDVTRQLGSSNPLRIVYVARATEGAGIPHSASVDLTNTARLAYTDAAGNPPSDPAVLARLTSSQRVTVVQPLFDGLVKTDISGRTSPYTPVDLAGEIMNFRLQATNSGDAPAYGVVITDDLPAELNEGTISNIEVSVGGTLLAAGEYTYTPPALRGGQMVFALSEAVDPSEEVSIAYDIGFYTDIDGGQNWQNTFAIDEYWSQPPADAQRYGPTVVPAPYLMSTLPTTVDPLQKLLLQPVSGTAVVGEEVVYQLRVPSSETAVAIYDLVITDTLDPSLQVTGIRELNGLALADNSSGNAVSLSLDRLPAGGQALIEIRARVANNATAQAGHSFANSASYTYAATDNGPAVDGGSGTAAALTIAEPAVALTKTIDNQTSPGDDPDAGDTLRLTLQLSEAGAANSADALDLLVREELSLGLAFVPGSATFAGSPLADPVQSGDGIAAGQTLRWDRSNSDLDIPRGTSAQLSYDVRVLDTVLAAASLGANSRVQWTSLNDDNSAALERSGSESPPLNDYFVVGATPPLAVANDANLNKNRLTDSFNSADNQLRVGDLVEYELRVALPEGRHPSAVLTDTLPQGMVFERTLSVNGDTSAPFAAVAPFSHGDIAEPVASGDPQAGATTIAWAVADLVNPGDNVLSANTAANDEFVIRYLARVLNRDAHPWPANSIPLENSAKFTRETASGIESLSGLASVELLQPNLAVAIAATTSNPAGGSQLTPGDTVDFTATISNSGSAPAYDLVFRDLIPAGLRQGGVSVQATSVNGAAVANLAPAYDPASGEVIWNFGAGSAYAIEPGQALVMTYRVLADASIGAGMALQNAAFAEVYYSLDDDALPTLAGGSVSADMREDYGPTAPVGVQFSTPSAADLRIENTRPTASIGEPFAYRVTIPGTAQVGGQSAALNDVQLLLNLDSSAAELVFVEAVKVAGSAAFTPVNSGSATNLVIEDSAGGIDVPAGEQVVIDVMVRLRDANPPNVDGLAFNNSASYRYGFINDDAASGQGAGGGNTTADMTVVEPTQLTLSKSGPARVQAGLPGTFVLDAHNTGSGPAWDITLTDRLPDTAEGGMCETAPDNFSAQIVDGGGNPQATLNAGSDFSVAYDAASCTLTFTSTGAAAMLPADHHLQINYDATLDADTRNDAALTNIAGIERWHSWDSGAADARAYNRPAPTDGTPAVLDHEAAFETLAAVASVSFHKEVANITTGASPASPGDVLQYTLTLTNLSDLNVSGIGITDELGRLNSAPVYQSGTLQLISLPAGADATATDAAGGAHGSGLLNVQDIQLAPQGSSGDTVQVVYQVTLAPVIDSGYAVLNQAEAQLPGQQPLLSDDPTINGTDDPDVPGDEDPTQVLITSAPLLSMEKVSQDLSGAPDLLLAGDTLRYTLRVQNSGNENTAEAVLRDQIPANTSYVAGSTTLNGQAVADANGTSPLSSGLAISSPGAGSGVLLADPTASAGNGEAVITFEVTVNAVSDGTLISNQGFLNGAGAGSGAFAETPSDDPATDTVNDPTMDIVGDMPLLLARKSVAIEVDNLSAGIVDPGDTLRYTIVVENLGAVDATEVELTDLIPANTSYVAGSTTLNNFPLSDSAGGSPLASGLPISSEDLTPPLPGALQGVISPGRSATVEFAVTVDAGTPSGTVISNQGSIASTELLPLLTDADDNPANGAQPTDVVVGDVQQLAITKAVAVVGGGAAEPGAILEYLITVTNIGAVPASDVVITDDLLLAGDGVLSYISDSARLDGLSAGVAVSGSVISANYAAAYGDLQPQDAATLRFQARLGAELAIGTPVLNTAMVEWNTPPASAQASVAIDVGGTPGIANLAGYLWQDANFNSAADSDEPLLQNWTVELYFNGNLIDTTQSDDNGYFQFAGLLTNLSQTSGGPSYELRYVAPGAGANTAALGRADSDFTNGPQRISDIYLGSGMNPQNLNLPLTPNGVVYDSVLRAPVSGATVTMLRASSGVALPDSCFDDPKQQGQVTQASGFYKFDLNFTSGGCPAGSDYLLQVTLPADDYVAGESAIIPPQTHADTAGFDVAACLGSGADAVPATAEHCEAQASPAAPSIDIAARSPATDYYLRLRLDDNRLPGESQLFNNHIAVDPQLDGALSITKTAAMLNVTRAQLVPYTITFSNTLSAPLTDLQLVDFFPAGFKYVAGSARVDGVAMEPEVDGLQLRWSGLRVDPEQTRSVKLLLVVGSGVGEGEYVNRAQLFNSLSGQVVSGQALATVRVIPDPTFDCTDVIGKVYDDKNMNGYPDAGEGGVPGARVVTATGLNATTDAHGRFHITCALVPNQDRGSNFVLKLDDRSLPSGYRLTSENPRVVRATRGKMIKVNFGSSLHRVVRLDMAEGVFEPQSTAMRPQWNSRTELLLQKLQEAPSVLRLSYLAEIEDPELVERRLQAMKARIAQQWLRDYGDYELKIETEVFWRRGAPPERGVWK
ncbi:hypothetical protein Maes01_01272 [Microbulbifer aestuariivivens]|uniref:DUF11 domain-containing protein n=1 Tax=Microbulbifer aestuariivivens TaxID=1908308 RepID=A0ABP9WNL7_9GAMM